MSPREGWCDRGHPFPSQVFLRGSEADDLGWWPDLAPDCPHESSNPAEILASRHREHLAFASSQA